MEKAEAFALFREKKLHPHCPVDGHKGLHLVSVALEKGEMWHLYRCKRCHQKFRATVMPEPVDLKV